MRIVIVTGMSGAGKSTAMRALEDIGFFCTDNLPLPLMPSFLGVMDDLEIADVALVVDTRQREYLDEYRAQLEAARARGHHVELLFLDADDEALLRRYSETRRRHPLAGDDLRDGIRRDRAALAGLRADARNAILSTGSLTVHQLKGIIQERFGCKHGRLAITLLSFGFKHGLPVEADLVWDVRFLANPYFVESLSARDGRDTEVSRFVLDTEEGRDLVDHVDKFLRFVLPQFQREGKLYLTVAIGCTGGRHRSVAVVEEIGARLGAQWDLVVRHRDLARG